MIGIKDLIYIVFFVYLFCLVRSKNKEKMTSVSSKDDIKKMINEVYRADVEAIRNLSDIADQLQGKGKYKNKKRVGVLLKNNATRKKITQELGILQKTPISKVKAYLREKNLLKLGSKVPDNIARQIFTNCILSGDVINKNYNVMVHNFLQ